MDEQRFTRLKDVAQSHGCALVNAGTSTTDADGTKVPSFELWSGNDLLVSSPDLDEIEDRLRM